MLIDNFAKLSRSVRFGTSAALIIIVAITMYDHIISPQANRLFAEQRHESALNDIIKQQKILNGAVESRKIELQQLKEQFNIESKIAKLFEGLKDGVSD